MHYQSTEQIIRFSKWLSAILALSFSFFCQATELKGTPEELRQFLHPHQKTVTLRAKVEETAFADKATVNLIIKTEDDKLSVALQQSDKIKTAIAKAMIASGVKAKDVNTSKFSTSPQYGWFGDEPDSYQIVARVAINISSSEQLKAIAALVDQYKEVNMGTTSYRHSDKDKVKNKLRKKAIAKISRSKADYEKDLGVKLKAVTFSDSDIGLQPTAGAEERIVVTGSRMSKSRRKSNSLADYQAAPVPNLPQSFDEVKYQLDVWVQYKIVQ